MSAGTFEDGRTEHGAAAHIEEVDVEELVERSAAEVYPQARRKQQRFSSVVEGPIALVLANPTRIRRAVVSLLSLSVALAPRGALVRVESRGSREEWALRIHASASKASRRGAAQLAEALREETKALSAVSRDVRPQGGLVWAELLGPNDLALCLTLPVEAGEEQSVPA